MNTHTQMVANMHSFRNMHEGQLWLSMSSRSSINHRVGGLIPSFSCLHGQVSLDKTLNTKLLAMVRIALCMVSHCHQGGECINNSQTVKVNGKCSHLPNACCFTS